MIKLEAAHIEEMRGIRKLDIDFHKSTFVISGPNGSGKSGVIDAIEFGLTGEIGRLTGRGTKGLALSEHGPHVDRMRTKLLPRVSCIFSPNRLAHGVSRGVHSKAVRTPQLTLWASKRANSET